MSFLSPLMLIGLAAALIPPLIHLLHRQKIKVHRFPALEFILRSHRKTARRFRIKQWLLILLRSAVLAALALAAAQPIFERRAAALEGEEAARGHVVFVLDAGYPMRYRLEGERLFDRARLQIGEMLTGARGQAALIIAGDQVEAPLPAPTAERALIQEALEAAEPGYSVAPLSEAITRAYGMLAVAPPGPRHVIVLTTRAGAASPAPQPPSGDYPVTLHLLDSAEGAPTPNDALLSVSARPAPEVGAGRWRVDARVGHYAATPAPRTPVRLEIDGQVVARAFVDLEPGGEGGVTFFARVEGLEAAPMRVALEPDALAEDDARDFWLHPSPRINLLAVNGDPRPSPIDDELFYFERALAPNATAQLRVGLKIIGADQLTVEALEGVDVLVLANASALRPRVSAAIARLVEGGGGLLVTMGDRVDPLALNRHLGALLPRTLRDARSAGDAAASAEGGDRRAARLSHFHPDHPILTPFEDPRASSLAVASIRRYMLLDPAAEARGEVVIGLDEGAPFLLTRGVGRGRVALLCGTLDRGWGDLPIHPDFLPLIQRTIRYLTRARGARPVQTLLGRAAPISIEDLRAGRARITGPDGALFTQARPASGPWLFHQTLIPGRYEVAADPPLPDQPPAVGFSVGLDPAGADLGGVAGAQAPGALGDGDPAPLQARVELWHVLLFSLFLLLLLEGIVLFKRRAHQGDADRGHERGANYRS